MLSFPVVNEKVHKSQLKSTFIMNQQPEVHAALFADHCVYF